MEVRRHQFMAPPKRPEGRDLGRLPSWAQSYIAQLETAFCDQEQTLRDLGDTEGGPIKIEHRSHVFTFPATAHVRIRGLRFHLDGDLIYGIGDQRLRIYPHAANSITIGMENY